MKLEWILYVHMNSLYLNGAVCHWQWHIDVTTTCTATGNKDKHHNNDDDAGDDVPAD